MTRARAVELLKGIQFCCDFDDCTNAWDCDECVEALNMAIEELEKESIIRCGQCNKSDWKGDALVYLYCEFWGQPVNRKDYCCKGEEKK